MRVSERPVVHKREWETCRCCVEKSDQPCPSFSNARLQKIVSAQRKSIVSIISRTGAPRPNAPHPKIDRPPPRENPRGTTFRAVEVEHYEATMFPGRQIRGGSEWNPKWDE